MKSKDTPVDIDKRALWGWWAKNADNREKLDMKVAHKALDIPEDNEVNVSTTTGMSWKELAVIAASMIGGFAVYNNITNPETPEQPIVIQQPAPQQPQVVQPIQQPIDSEYVIRFFDAEGNEIEVPHISKMKQ